MSSPATASASRPRLFDAAGRHRIRWGTAALLAVSFLVAVALEGYSFYKLPLAERIHHASYDELRPSGSIGLKLGMLGGFFFLLIYLYPIRKRWPWLRKFGNTKHWLDFHVLMGLFGPAVITFHSSFKFHGLAGMAFWIMWTIAVSGVIGRYFYSKIPRRITAVELTRAEAEETRSKASATLQDQDLFQPEELESAVRLPSDEQVQSMPLLLALATMIYLDLSTPFQVSRLRRKLMSGPQKILSLGGLLPLGNQTLESIIRSVRQEIRLSSKLLFLSKTQQLFHLWHVVHRPFSYSFSVLVVVHIAFVVYLGYF